MTDSTPSPEVLPLSAALQIASYAGIVAGDKHRNIEYTQAEQRIRIINAWAPALGPGSRVLEIGCGQGTSTQALAEAVGEAGHIDAVDPGDPDYGGPLTLAQAQAHLSNGPIGKRITWHNADPVAFLGDHTDKTWDVAILAYSIWYFKSPQALREILEALKGRVNKVLVAEHGLHATNKEAIPHVLAAFARATLEAHRKNSDENIQNVMSPAAIKKVATAAGWVVEKEGIVVPDAGLSDGQWETGTVASESFLQTIEQSIEDERVKNVLISARDSVLSALAAIGGKVAKAQTMDTWVGTLVPV